MQYHIDTIPVWDAFRAGGECPLCTLHAKLEEDFVDLALGGAAMEPDVRIASNEKGYCARHLSMLYASQRRLPLALVAHTHMLDLHQRLKPALERAAAEKPSGGLFRKSGGDAAENLRKALAQGTSTCMMCDRIRSNMERYLYTVLHLYGHDAEFKTAFREGRGFCLTHAEALLDMAEKHLHGAAQTEFVKDLAKLEDDALTRLEEELYNFTQMFDYRSAGKDFGTCRDALPRTMTKLRGGLPEEKKSSKQSS